MIFRVAILLTATLATGAVLASRLPAREPPTSLFIIPEPIAVTLLEPLTTRLTPPAEIEISVLPKPVAMDMQEEARPDPETYLSGEWVKKNALRPVARPAWIGASKHAPRRSLRPVMRSIEK